MAVCHCDYCQRRTGNVFQVSCWYYNDQIESRSGTGSVYSGPDNPGIDYTFCSRCGSTVYWKYTVLKDALGVTVYGVAVGCFVDANFPEPELECWASKRHHWIADLEDTDSYKENPPMEWRIPQRSRIASQA